MAPGLRRFVAARILVPLVGPAATEIRYSALLDETAEIVGSAGQTFYALEVILYVQVTAMLENRRRRIAGRSRAGC